jgi:hypothetical protein
MTISDKLNKLLQSIDSPISSELLEYSGDIESMDITGANNLVTYKKGKHSNRSKVGAIVKSIFDDKFSDKQIWQFVEEFKKAHDSLETLDLSGESDVFKWVASNFRKLTTKTYPHGTEDQVVKLMDLNLSKDAADNYYYIVPGDDTTMFTSHLDTASYKDEKVGYRIGKDSKGQTFAYTDGSSILGADDKAGVVIMLYMIKNKVPGIYYFFIGEERGMIGSSDLSYNLKSHTYLQNVNKCISFDRRDYYSVITHQMGRQCCSNEFANSLISELNKNGMKMSQDPTGIYTDSAAFMTNIAECTNISVGYFNEHTSAERQNLNHLTSLAEASIKVKWSELIVARGSSFSQNIKEKYESLIDLINSNSLENQITFEEEDGTLVIYLEIETTTLDDTQRDIQILHTILSRSGQDYSTEVVANVLKLKMLN